ncbi:hypothetical protein OAO46_00925 [Candidatus Poseidonia alphae]|nr:hypothetical protein [Candidatus Poseidonia alphae]
MERHVFEVGGKNIHFAVEGSTGGTSFGLHLAADTIANNGRVLWASSDLPDGTRFSQLFSHLSLVESSRFHAMNFGGKFERAIDAMIEAVHGLPSVKLVVLDDWCDNTGRIPAQLVSQVSRLAKETGSGITLLLISKGSADASGKSEHPIVARGDKVMADAGFETWKMWRRKEGATRTIVAGEEILDVQIKDSGFHI